MLPSLQNETKKGQKAEWMSAQLRQQEFATDAATQYIDTL
jgi:hypothetical protein